ncbi:hypothetical protein AN958_03448 [Leucoagaricus sp. SymC.cos]|nr:hypothetical protein AN958_03448 [Leucoagaricus sp. SymC.cos]
MLPVHPVTDIVVMAIIVRAFTMPYQHLWEAVAIQKVGRKIGHFHLCFKKSKYRYHAFPCKPRDFSTE